MDTVLEFSDESVDQEEQMQYRKQNTAEGDREPNPSVIRRQLIPEHCEDTHIRPCTDEHIVHAKSAIDAIDRNGKKNHEYAAEQKSSVIWADFA